MDSSVENGSRTTYLPEGFLECVFLKCFSHSISSGDKKGTVPTPSNSQNFFKSNKTSWVASLVEETEQEVFKIGLCLTEVGPNKTYSNGEPKAVGVPGGPEIESPVKKMSQTSPPKIDWR